MIQNTAKYKSTDRHTVDMEDENNSKNGVGRWLTGQQHLLSFQKTWISPEPTGIRHSSFQESDTSSLRAPDTDVVHATRMRTTLIHIKKLNMFFSAKVIRKNKSEFSILFFK